MTVFDQLLIGKSPELLEVIRSAQVVAATDVNVVLLGESGTGKERLAKGIHGESGRRHKAFVSINCAALPETLAESMLFGHRKGAFTGATDHHEGYLSAADKGTLFLDEVGELPASVQAKLLRFLESGECLPVGQTRPRTLDVRIIAATNRDLRDHVRSGLFRADLYYRLYVVPLELPPLRQRGSDLELLLQQLTRELARQHGLPAPTYPRPTLRALRAYPWPGNVRELRNFAERMLVLLGGRNIEVEQLPAEIRDFSQSCVQGYGAFELPESGISLDRLEANIIAQALRKARGNRSRAARLLGLTRDTLLYRVKKYAIEA